MAIIIPYVPQTWVDGNTSNPVSAARMGVIEEGIKDVSQSPAVRVFHNAAQSITTSTFTALAFNSERFDQAGGVASTQHDTVTNNSRLTCLYAGVYLITANVEWAANATGERILRVVLNGATEIVRDRRAGTNTLQNMVVATPYVLAVNDYVETNVWQSSGGGLNVNSSGNISPEFSMVRVA